MNVKLKNGKELILSEHAKSRLSQRFGINEIPKAKIHPYAFSEKGHCILKCCWKEPIFLITDIDRESYTVITVWKKPYLKDLNIRKIKT